MAYFSDLILVFNWIMCLIFSQAYLTEFLQSFSRLPYYKTFSQHHTDSETQVLRTVGISLWLFITVSALPVHKVFFSLISNHILTAVLCISDAMDFLCRLRVRIFPDIHTISAVNAFGIVLQLFYRHCNWHYMRRAYFTNTWLSFCGAVCTWRGSSIFWRIPQCIWLRSL